MKHWYKIFTWVLCLTLWCSLPTPVQAGMIGKQEEISMGQEASRQIEGQYGVVHDTSLQSRVQMIGAKLLEQVDNKDYEYSFKVLNSDEINAMAVPGGHIYVYRGLINRMPSDDELAAVLGHEIGHVVRRHTVKQMEKQMAVSILSMLAGIAAGDAGAGMAMASTVGQALMAGYSRADEREADEIGFQLLMLAGYNPYGSYVTMCKLEDLAKEYGNPGYGLFSSHPEPQIRKSKNLKLLEPYQLKAQVTITGTQAKVTDGKFTYTYRHGIDGGQPEYRARMLAGALYLIRQKKEPDSTHFIIMDEELYSDVYYEDIHISRFYGVDALGQGTPASYARDFVAGMQSWVEELHK